MASRTAPSGAVVGLTLVGVALMAWSFFAPIWWVSLTAPNYPKETFPWGVRIHMHWNHVANGCEMGRSAEIQEALDCVEEMNTINLHPGCPVRQGARRVQAPWLFLAFGAFASRTRLQRAPLVALVRTGDRPPIGFLVDFSAWLWWFGHNLHPWAAFTVKPFMPTVLGEGKVAQFSTYSYPHYGFALTVAAAACLALALLRRRKELQGAEAPLAAPSGGLREVRT
jgi:hypothetical protein